MDDFSRFFDHALDLNAIADENGFFRRVNGAWERTLGWSAEAMTAAPWLEFVHPDDRPATLDVGARLFEGASIVSFENRYRCTDGSYRWIQWHAEAVGAEAYCTGRDVTSAHESALRDVVERRRDLLRELFDAMPQLGWTAQPDGFIDYYNRGWYEYTGTTYEDMQGWGWQSVHDPDELPRVMESWTHCIATSQPFEQEFPLRGKDGVYRWFLTRVTPIFDETGKLVRWVGINTDIDDRRRADTTVALLAEKTSLLQEVHHRVKNNLQLISSLLHLQAKQTHDKEARASFLETQGRVHSIALLHESLYQSDDLGRVDMDEYVPKLVVTLKRTFGQTGSDTRFVLELDRIHLPVHAAVPCGLIMNELITNAMKHAFIAARDPSRNEIRVELRRAGDDRITLLIADNGGGFPGAVDPTRDETLGLTLVRDLSAQLRGHVEFATANGARCTVTFPTPGQTNQKIREMQKMAGPQ